VNNGENARFRKRIRVRHGAGVGRDLIPSRDFVSQRPGEENGQQRYG
jgi:hypothetical protein